MPAILTYIEKLPLFLWIFSGFFMLASLVGIVVMLCFDLKRIKS
jgi:hypothetical protein